MTAINSLKDLLVDEIKDLYDAENQLIKALPKMAKAEAIEADAPPAIRDANLIGAAQRVEHYEMAAYGTARAFAEELGEDTIAQLLQETLDEEVDTDKKLTALSATVNEEACLSGVGSED